MFLPECAPFPPPTPWHPKPALPLNPSSDATSEGPFLTSFGLLLPLSLPADTIHGLLEEKGLYLSCHLLELAIHEAGASLCPTPPPPPAATGQLWGVYTEGLKEGLACLVSLQLCLHPHVWPVGRVELPDLLHLRATLGRVRRAGRLQEDGGSSPFPVPYKLGNLERVS